jgi:hypothetical protein
VLPLIVFSDGMRLCVGGSAIGTMHTKLTARLKQGRAETQNFRRMNV